MTPADLLAVLQATWPAAKTLDCGPFTLRQSDGGGQRVTAASLTGPETLTHSKIERAEHYMQHWGQRPLFTLLPDQTDLDDMLESRGYTQRDPTLLMCGPMTPLLEIETPRLSTFEITPPLGIMREIWADGGVGADRLDVMARADCPKAMLMARHDNAPAGVAYIAALGRVAMVHALEIPPTHRRKGVARRLMGRAAQWATAQGCDQMGLAVTLANEPAQSLYRSLGMSIAGSYHYRRHPSLL